MTPEEKENIHLYTSDAIAKAKEDLKAWVQKEFAIKLVEKVLWGILIAITLGVINYLIPTLFHPL